MLQSMGSQRVRALTTERLNWVHIHSHTHTHTLTHSTALHCESSGTGQGCVSRLLLPP